MQNMQKTMTAAFKSFAARSQQQWQARSQLGRKAGVALCLTAAGGTGVALATSKDFQQLVMYGARRPGRRAFADTVVVPDAGISVGADVAGAGKAGAALEPRKKVVFAFDTTDASQYAFEWALENFFHAEDTVLLLNVRPNNEPPQSIEEGVTPLSERQARMQEIERLDRIHYELSEARGKAYEHACRAKGISCQAVHAMGNPAVRIVDVGAETDADCIVLGTHDRGTLGRLTIGGVPTYVVHNAHCPVIVARPKKHGPVEHESPYQEERVGPMTPDMVIEDERRNLTQEEFNARRNRKGNAENLWRLTRKFG